MAGNRSFRDYIADRFYNDMFAAIQKCVEQGSEFSNSLRYREPSKNVIDLSDIDVKFVYVNDLPGTRIEFDVTVEAELEVYQSVYRYECTNSYSRWLVLKCSGDLDCNLDDFEILSIAEYTGKNKHPRPMSDALVPIIKKEQLESVATDFLRRHYPEALIEPMAVDPYVLTEKMGLTIETRQITKDLSVFGQIFFHDCDTEFYDEDKDEMVLTHVSARTIVVDPKVYFQYNFGTVNNTIIHECVHWDLHRKAFELERLYNSSATKIKCQVVGGIKGINSDATDWMEWQANALAPRIQMPYEMFKLKANELIEKYRYELGTDELIDVIELVIDDLAAFFNVSRTAAKIRMIDAGYEEAIGTFTYIDGRYVKPHRFKKGVLKRNQTFSIGAIDAAIQSITNPQMAELVGEGGYIYVDSHFVLNHPKYLAKDIFGQTVLTDYARTHMEECCLVFELSVKSGCREKYYTECFLNRDKSSKIDFDIKYCNGYDFANREVKAKILAETLAEETQIYNKLPNSYLDSLKIVRDWRKMTYKDLAEQTMLSERTKRRIFNGEEPGSINSIILICLGLNLPPIISSHIIRTSPFDLNLSNPSHMWYQFALTHLYAKSMDEIRDFLQEHGADPL